MITDNDVQKIITAIVPALTSVFATKEDLRLLEEKMATKGELTQFKSDILDKLDAVYGELKTMREVGRNQLSKKIIS